MIDLVGCLLFAALALLCLVFLDGPDRGWALVPAAFAFLRGVDWWLARRLRRNLALVACLVLAVVILPSLAHAAEPITVGALFGDMRETIATVLGVIASGIVALIAWGVHRLTGVKLDESTRNALQSAMENGIQAGLGAIQGMANSAQPETLQNRVVQVALGYVREFAPGAVRHFGLTDERLRDLLRAQLAKAVPTDFAPIANAPIRS